MQSITQNNFALLKEKVEKLWQKVKNQDKLKHSYMQKSDLIAVLSTFLLIIESRQTEYFYAFRVTINSALLKIKQLKNDIEEINQITDQIVRGIYE